MHTTVVADVHALLPQASAAVSEAVAVGPAAPKLSPLMVTVPPLPLGAELAEAMLTTGAAYATPHVALAGSGQRAGKWRSAPSKLNCPTIVPATALTLTAVCITAEPPYACGAHATVVADVHALLPHASAVVSEAVAVGPTAPKPSPLIVTVPPPLGAAFAETVLTTGAGTITLASTRLAKREAATYRRRRSRGSRCW